MLGTLLCHFYDASDSECVLGRKTSRLDFMQ